jgi:thiamine-phosphate pyrophosphorylase
MDEKPCGLISIVPPTLEPEWAAKLAEFVNQFKPAALILQSPPSKAAAELIAKAKACDLAVLLADSVDAAREARASGVYVAAQGAGTSSARKALGADAIIGLACGLSRHDAMEAAEAGADFVAFDASGAEALEQAKELSQWWDEMTGVPSALLLAKMRPSRFELTAARADFLIVEECERAGESLIFATEIGLQSQT